MKSLPRFFVLWVLLLFGLPAGTGTAEIPVSTDTNWFADAIWYQIFPERFRNGDRSNDPTPKSLDHTWPFKTSSGWKISPWTSDWYALQPWEKSDGRPFYVHAQLRRYGGDIQGIIDRLDYLQKLGVNALYLNPVFDSPSLHKYGASCYHHIDRHFGPDPEGDTRIMAGEDPADPATWKWTAADRLFLKLVRETHRRGMRIILDGVFNHVGIPFWALQRARSEGPSSRFAKWFHITRWDDPSTPADEFDYQGWAGVKDLPEFAKNEIGPHAGVKEHFRHVLKRWMDPDGDGNPKDGIDGWRLDVAAEVPLPFWEEFRGWVKGINPSAYITGEIWWEDYNQNTFRNPAPWLNQAFDGVMHYRVGDAIFQFFNQPDPLSATAFTNLLTLIYTDCGPHRSHNQQNILSSHDVARTGSAVVNPLYRQDHGASVSDNQSYEIRAPNAEEKLRWRQIVAFQFFAPGAPLIYYGDEVGMWGADDPDCRKPMLWSDLNYEPERTHPFGLMRTTDPVRPDMDQLAFFRKAIELRRKNPALARGSCTFLRADDLGKYIVMERRLGRSKIWGLFNTSDRSIQVDGAEIQPGVGGQWRDLWTGKRHKESRIQINPHGFRWVGIGE